MANNETKHTYQKRLPIFQNKKRVLLQETGKKKKLLRYYKNMSLCFRTTKEATEGTYNDKKCPVTSYVFTQGQILSCIVTNMNRQKTTVMHRDTLHSQKYKCLEMQHENMSKHLSCHSASGMSRWVTLSHWRNSSHTEPNATMNSR